MNIVSTMVGITIAGVAAPSVMQMSLAPVEAQVRARNFSQAESAAVTFSSKFEGQTDAEWVVIGPWLTSLLYDEAKFEFENDGSYSSNLNPCPFNPLFSMLCDSCGTGL